MSWLKAMTRKAEAEAKAAGSRDEAARPGVTGVRAKAKANAKAKAKRGTGRGGGIGPSLRLAGGDFGGKELGMGY